ncbi:MAG: DUF3311 domain-containing protein [Candidatus Eremiobacteraeota bacterium]|nr:DUF3311 domain-containing protein [Candidatus Eremiobacteraeota bacterium]
MRRPLEQHSARKRWHWLLLLPFIFMLWPPFYARVEPALAGIPFFYWYQFVWVVLSALTTGAVYLLTHE